MNEFASLPVVRALGWAICHSLWQGAALGLLAAGFLRAAQRSSPEFRYRLASTALGLMVLAFIGTLIWLLPHDAVGSASGGDLLTPLLETGHVAGWWARFRLLATPWMPWLFLAWILGFILRILQLGRAMTWLYGPCLDSFRPPPAEWLARFEALKVRSQVRFPVRLGLSDQVDSLVVLGWLKPVVLVPAAALMALSPEGLEALLAHELAHVRRSDFLANVLQSFAEALLFYHPSVWWLSRRIRQEREHCCDDVAVQACGDPLLYVSALAGLEELRSQPTLVPDLAPGASGGRLMSRIHRLLHPRSVHNTSASLATLIPALLLMVTLGLAPLSCTSPVTVAPTTGPVEMDFSKIRIRHQPDAPPYPFEAKAQRIQGTVVVVVTIGLDGRVIKAKALSGPVELQACAVDYASSWEFEPAEAGGRPVAARFNLTMPFRLR